mmetsp:Transcript_32496/g.87256  ORF Transcript_32496/g.87256 Transcript_32496/m.87256 type:complete len:221 (-) Transcript_32496:169-831(-)
MSLATIICFCCSILDSRTSHRFSHSLDCARSSSAADSAVSTEVSRAARCFAAASRSRSTSSSNWATIKRSLCCSLFSALREPSLPRSVDDPKQQDESCLDCRPAVSAQSASTRDAVRCTVRCHCFCSCPRRCCIVAASSSLHSSNNCLSACKSETVCSRNSIRSTIRETELSALLGGGFSLWSRSDIGDFFAVVSVRLSACLHTAQAGRATAVSVGSMIC